MNTPSNYRPIAVGDIVMVDGDSGYLVLALPDKHGYWTLKTTGYNGTGKSVIMTKARRIQRYDK